MYFVLSYIYHNSVHQPVVHGHYPMPEPSNMAMINFYDDFNEICIKIHLILYFIEF